MKGIAILGTGPAGLMAAQACVITGRPFSLFGLPGEHHRAQASVISGAQFIHEPVPSVSDPKTPDFALVYRKRGTADGYAAKVYASDPRVPFVSFNNVEDNQAVSAWSMEKIYGELWHGIAGEGHSVNAMRIGAAELDEWMRKDLWDAVVCTIPRDQVCMTHAGLVDRAPHGFLSQDVVIMDSLDMGVSFNEIVYNGDPDQSWYRSANIGGHQSTEWGPENVPPYYASQARTVTKPISHNCDCWADRNVVFAGRYGKWEKGILVQDAFRETFKLIERLDK